MFEAFGHPCRWLVPARLMCLAPSRDKLNGVDSYFANQLKDQMLDDKFDKYVQVIVVPKQDIPSATLALFLTPAEVLPPWDPMSRILQTE